MVQVLKYKQLYILKESLYEYDLKNDQIDYFDSMIYENNQNHNKNSIRYIDELEIYDINIYNEQYIIQQDLNQQQQNFKECLLFIQENRNQLMKLQIQTKAAKKNQPLFEKMRKEILWECLSIING
ncbi:hypothetical protein PPERSA_03220 [Pseudocohnilembus persalinus]|uniref:Uncharacterized protein n=1 Tax=Pseudocohnilembus persalinus TaxID=266149 RepID=A0A0V0QE63_PSEPJ|nr:hypothetical protein PPERSA_03220 [Pseudocohnilembus persalinus]|eukprot:KRX00487.1 hypothetical protein PPERSA_03220 [Pseudocohnilembus persalinus]